MKIPKPISKQPLPTNAKRVFKGVLFDIYQWEQAGYDGQIKIFEKAKRADSAMVIPVTSEGKIILCEQEQPGKHQFTGLIGGRLDQGEGPLEAAKRELLEEAGYASIGRCIHLLPNIAEKRRRKTWTAGKKLICFFWILTNLWQES